MLCNVFFNNYFINIIDSQCLHKKYPTKINLKNVNKYFNNKSTHTETISLRMEIKYYLNKFQMK